MGRVINVKFVDEDGNLFAICYDGRNIVKTTGEDYAILEGNNIISYDGDFIGSICQDNVSKQLVVISEDGDFMFTI